MNGRVTPLDVARNIIKVYKEKQEKSNGLIEIDELQLLNLAEESTKRYQIRKPLSILDGAPFVVKDSVDVAGYATRYGLRSSTTKCSTDAPTVARLKSMGAIIVGKSNMDELNMDVRGLNTHYDLVKNPYNLQHESGGPSSGSASLVSSNFVPFSIGDTCIQTPSALCGIFGLKPTYARVPRCYQDRLGTSVSCAGPLANDAITLALAYTAIAGIHPNDNKSMMQPPIIGVQNLEINNPNFYSLNGLRIGFYSTYFNDVKEKEISLVVKQFLDKEICGHLKGNLVNVTLPLLEELLIAYRLTIGTEILSNFANEYQSQRHLLSSPTRLSFLLLSKRIGLDYVNAQRIRYAAMEAYKQIFESVDVIVVPTTAISAPKLPTGSKSELDPQASDNFMQFSFLANFLGLPAISIPVGFTKKGLPIGIQFISKWWCEEILLKLAILCEKQIGERKQPALNFELLSSPIEQRILSEAKKTKEYEEKKQMKNDKDSVTKKVEPNLGSKVDTTKPRPEVVSTNVTQENAQQKSEDSPIQDPIYLEIDSDDELSTPLVETPKSASESKEDRARQKRLYAMAEFLTTERTYVRNLVVLQERFIIPSKGILSEKDHKQLFAHLDVILNTNTLFLSELEKVLVNNLSQEQQEEDLAKLMLRISQMFKLYTPYISDYNHINQLGNNLMKKNKKFEELCNNACRELKKEKHTLYTFFGFMITPIQRIPRMRLLLDEILKNTNESTVQYDNLKRASSLISDIAVYCNEKTRESENMGKLLELDRTLKLNILAPHRRFIDEMKGSRIRGNGRTSKCKAFLFNDLLVVMDSSSLSALGFNSSKQITLDVELGTTLLPMPNSKSIAISYEAMVPKTRSRRISLKLSDLENMAKEDEKQSVVKKVVLNFTTEKQAKEWEKRLCEILTE